MDIAAKLERRQAPARAKTTQKPNGISHNTAAHKKDLSSSGRVSSARQTLHKHHPHRRRDRPLSARQCGNIPNQKIKKSHLQAGCEHNPATASPGSTSHPDLPPSTTKEHHETLKRQTRRATTGRTLSRTSFFFCCCCGQKSQNSTQSTEDLRDHLINWTLAGLKTTQNFRIFNLRWLGGSPDHSQKEGGGCSLRPHAEHGEKGFSDYLGSPITWGGRSRSGPCRSSCTGWS